ncbi:MAG: hypothetical protein WCW93_00685 [Candidatus Paceibacterota bacterium]
MVALKFARRGGKKKVIKKVKAVKKTVVKKIVKKATKKVVKKVAKKKVVKKIPYPIKKFKGNPIAGPVPNSFWQSEAVFNPGAVVHDGRIHLFYRALGGDGLSRIGYTSSKDGIHFDERLSYPVFVAENINEAQDHYPYTSPARLVYNPVLYASGGGWGGCEDPRAVKIDGRIYLTFNMFNGWESMRVAFTSIDGKDLLEKKWNWSQFAYLSRPGDRQKNWVLFPEKFNGKFALFHNLDLGDSSRVHIKYLDELNMYKTPTRQTGAPDVQILPDHVVAWHNRTRSASAPPIKTKDGWLLFYHAMDKDDPNRYKVGALLLDLKDPTKILYRASRPILEPDEWYENDYKPGVVYASGAVVKDGTLFLYYGGGDKHIAVAYVNLKEFLNKLKSGGNAVFSKKKAALKI